MKKKPKKQRSRRSVSVRPETFQKLVALAQDAQRTPGEIIADWLDAAVRSQS